MITKVYKAFNDKIDKHEMKDAIAVIKNGGLVAFPTETVYGLGGDATNPEASKKIYAAKGRPSDNPLIVHIAHFSQLENIVENVSDEARALAEAFWPGPLTMILKKNDKIPYETTGGLDTVAIRMPNHPIAIQFLKESDCMVAAPSANLSGRPSPTTAKHVYDDLDGKIDVILDGGAVEIGIESTIVDLSEEIPTILRPGYITLDEISRVVGPVKMDPGLVKEDENVRPKAPGMRYRHYAPRAELTIIEGEDKKVVAKINELIESATQKGQKVGVISTEENKDCYIGGEVISIGKKDDEDEIARQLYKVLRDFDDSNVDVIYSEGFDTSGIGGAIMNRLIKAAGHRIIEV